MLGLVRDKIVGWVIDIEKGCKLRMAFGKEVWHGNQIEFFDNKVHCLSELYRSKRVKNILIKSYVSK